MKKAKTQTRLFKHIFIICLLICLSTLLCGCERDWAEIYPDINAQVEASVPVATESLFTGEAMGDQGEEQPKTITLPTQGKADAVPAFSSNEISLVEDNIRSIDIYYDGTMAMMGFVDIPMPSSSIYLQAVDLVRQKGSFTNAQIRMFRIDVDANDLSACRLNSEMNAADLSSRSFYITQRLTALPDQVVPEGAASAAKGVRINSFVPSYYSQNGLPEPEQEQLAAPAAWALERISDDSLSIIVSDLSELLMGKSSLSELLQAAYNRGLTVAVVAAKSDFAGIVPIKDGNKVWMQWGSMPTGTPIKTYSYEYETKAEKVSYTIPVCEPNNERYTAERPFYVLFIGRTHSMDRHVENFVRNLRLESPDITCEYQIFENDYRNASYVLSDHISVIEQETACNVNCIFRTISDVPVHLFELGKTLNNTDSTRSVMFNVANKPKDTNPSIGFFRDEYFFARLAIRPIQENGSLGEPVTLDRGTVALISDVKPDGTSFTLTIRHPVNVLTRGDYRVTVDVYQRQPEVGKSNTAFASFSAGVPSGQFYQTYNGSRTFGLIALLDGLAKTQQVGAGAFQLGAFQYDIKINEN